MAKARESRAVLCSKCRQLISNQEKTCPHCGALQPDLFGYGGPLRALFRDSLDPVNLLTGACVTLYAASLLGSFETLLSPPSLLDIGSPSGKVLYLMGMTGGAAWACGHLWTLLTASLLHGSILHIFFNLQWLRALGPMTVQLLGPARFVVLFLLSGVGGFLLSNVVSGDPTIGASCGLFGLMGGLMVFGWRRGGTIGAAMKSTMLKYAAIGFAISFAIPNVNNWGHAGGFLAGMAIAFLMPKFEGRHEGRGVQLLALALLVATAAGFGLSVWQMWAPFQNGGAVCAS